jgi:predicted transposase/invertase (TIGR01784 family)
MPTLAQQFREEFREEFIETLGPELKKEGKKEGIKEGIKEGKKEEKFEIARRMLLNNFSLDQVILSTGLTKKEIKTLIN